MKVLSALLLSAFAVPAFAQAPKLREVIDTEIRAGWKKDDIKPAELSSDSEFLRRLYLDLVGMIPTYDEAKAFLDDTSADKRPKLIEKLLADPRFAENQAAIWDLALFTRRPGEEVRLRAGFQKWFTKQFTDNKGFDEIAKQVLLGEQEDSQAYLARFRARPEDAAVDVARVFLGTQVQCARCHDHPFDKWSQKDFYGMAGFFVRLVVNESGPQNARKFVISERPTGDVLFSGAAKDQKPGLKGEPVKPRFLGAKTDLDEPPLPKDFKEPARNTTGPLPKPPFSRKEKFAEWATASDNPYFAKATVNRIWSQFMGRGIIHPIDDIGDHNTPSHEKLLEALIAAFKAEKFALKPLIREIVSSQTYQLSAQGGGKEALPKKFERARVRPLSAEELLASLKVASGAKPDEKFNNVTAEYFFRYFGEPTNGIGDFQGGLGEHLFLNNSGDIRAILARRKDNLAEKLVLSKDPWETKVERLFIAVLSRKPTEAETKRFVAHFSDPKGKPDGLVDEALWVLVNTAEFRFNK